MSENYNSERNNRTRKWNSRAVFTETASDVTPQEKMEAIMRREMVKITTRKKLNEN